MFRSPWFSSSRRWLSLMGRSEGETDARCDALGSQADFPSHLGLARLQVPEIYGWGVFLIAVSPSACWPLAPPSHLSLSPAAPARATGRRAPFPPHCPGHWCEVQPLFLPVPSPSPSWEGRSDLLNCWSAGLNPHADVTQVLHRRIFPPTHFALLLPPIPGDLPAHPGLPPLAEPPVPPLGPLLTLFLSTSGRVMVQRQKEGEKSGWGCGKRRFQWCSPSRTEHMS